MRKIISISIDETLLKQIDKSRGIATRSKFIETMLRVAKWRCQSAWNSLDWARPPEFPGKTI